jgi:hypothetical protein
MNDISICIPLHDPSEIYLDFVEDALNSISIQTNLPREIIISGASEPAYMNQILLKYAQFLSIRFLKNETTSTSSNLNFLVKRSTSEITKILFQDDFLISKNALENISNAFNDNEKVWLVSGSKNYDNQKRDFIRNIQPRFSNKIADGVNTIGSPSVVAFRTQYFIEFNEHLVWMLDCDWYLRMMHNFGHPIFLKEFQTASRLHDGQATHAAQNMHDAEVAMTRSSHSNLRSFLSLSRRRCICQNQFAGIK